jgi:hypothetical protein
MDWLPAVDAAPLWVPPLAAALVFPAADWSPLDAGSPQEQATSTLRPTPKIPRRIGLFCGPKPPSLGETTLLSMLRRPGGVQ